MSTLKNEPASSEPVAIVGAGLVGSLLASYLGRSGHSVEVFERRPDMRADTVGGGRSINLAVSTRGLNALEEVGLASEVLARAIPMRGRVIHGISGQLAFQAYGKTEQECINSISRADLNKILMNHAEASGRVRIHFQQKLVGIDEERRTLSFADERDHSERELGFNRVFGTDGTASVIRHEISRTMAGAFARDEPLQHGYKELVMPRGQQGRFAMEKNALHIWPRGTYMLIALPNFDGSFTCTLFLPFKGPLSFESLTSEQAVAEFFETQFPDAVALIPDFIEQFFANPTGHMTTVRCAPWHLKSMSLVLGDAAHAIVPFFGQGMNCGFEDCSLLAKLVGQHDDQGQRGDADWLALFQRFEGLRRPNTDGIATMAVENFYEMRDKVGQPRFLLRKEVEKVLEREFPGLYVSRYALVSFSLTPYGLAYRVGQMQDAILDELCATLSNAEDIDRRRAGELIAAKLQPIMAELT